MNFAMPNEDKQYHKKYKSMISIYDTLIPNSSQATSPAHIAKNMIRHFPTHTILTHTHTIKNDNQK